MLYAARPVIAPDAHVHLGILPTPKDPFINVDRC